VSSIFWRIIFQICKRNYKNARSCSRPILKERENFSLVSTSSPIPIFSRSYLKDHNLLPSKKISRSFSTPSLRSNSENLTKKEAVIRLLQLLSKNLEVLRRFLWLHTSSVRVTSNLGSSRSKRRCKTQWESIAETLQQQLWLNLWKPSWRVLFLRSVWWVSNSFGLIKSQKPLKKAKRKTKVLLNPRRNRLRRCFKNSQISVCNLSKHLFKEQRLKPWLPSMCIREISLLRWNAKTYLTLIGKNKPDFTGEVSRILVLSALQIGSNLTAMNS